MDNVLSKYNKQNYFGLKSYWKKRLYIAFFIDSTINFLKIPTVFEPFSNNTLGTSLIYSQVYSS